MVGFAQNYYPCLSPPNYYSTDYPADYVPPKMDLFSDDEPPLAYSSPGFCRADSLHLEKAFELLRYQHAFKLYGIPSVVNSGIRIVTGPTGSGSDGGTSTVIGTTIYGSPSSLSGSPTNWLLDRRLERRGNDESNNGSGSGAGSGGNPGDQDGMDCLLASLFRWLKCRIVPSAENVPSQPGSQHPEASSLGPAPPPPPPPPPPPGSSAPEDEDAKPFFSGTDHDWDVAWRCFFLGAAVGMVVNRILPMRRRGYVRKFLGSVSRSGFHRYSGLESDLDVAVLPGFSNYGFETYSTNNYTDGYGVPVRSFSGVAGFLRELLIFSGGTLKAVAGLLVLVCYALVRKIIGMPRLFRIIFRLCPTPSATVTLDDEDDVSEGPDRHGLDSESTAETTVLGRVGPELELVALMQELFISVEEPREESVPLIRVEQDHVDAFAPVPCSPSGRQLVPFTVTGVEQDNVEAFAPIPCSPLKEKLGLAPLDSFWDGHSSFVCSTPIFKQGNLSDMESITFERHLFEEFEDSAVGSCSSSQVVSDYVNAKKNLDALIETRIKEAESAELLGSVSHSFALCLIVTERVLSPCRDRLVIRCGPLLVARTLTLLLFRHCE